MAISAEVRDDRYVVVPQTGGANLASCTGIVLIEFRGDGSANWVRDSVSFECGPYLYHGLHGAVASCVITSFESSNAENVNLPVQVTGFADANGNVSGSGWAAGFIGGYLGAAVDATEVIRNANGRLQITAHLAVKGNMIIWRLCYNATAYYPPLTG